MSNNESYITIKRDGYFEYEDRKSVFIGQARPVSTEEEALAFIEEVRRRYPDARHNVYAYVCRENTIMRFSDDHEPQGTAGMPVLDAIRKNGCTDTAIVVTRYFGGTLLGTGGLVRAYSAAANGALKDGEIITYDIYTTCSIIVSYSDYQKLGAIFTDCGFRTEDTRFTDRVELLGSVRKSSLYTMLDKLTQATAGRAELAVLEEKYDF